MTDRVDSAHKSYDEDFSIHTTNWDGKHVSAYPHSFEETATHARSLSAQELKEEADTKVVRAIPSPALYSQPAVRRCWWDSHSEES